ncbi:hypothetical protein CMI41_02495 [Candidatus Pacearchaeota archaeon]|nr:hypothetical protein [Candidatus Pacearchaeota archaeon]|tara:strand:- start:8476 stop:9750 length:1275 start_codon:yes stop_codon:yes gene_type:complete
MNKFELLKCVCFIFTTLLFVVVVLFFAIDLFLHPPGAFIGEEYLVPADSVEFLYDLTYAGESGEIIYEQEIFNKIFDVIDGAEKFIIVDMFLFGEDNGKSYRNLTGELFESLIKKKENSPETQIYFITDSFNLLHLSSEKEYFDKLESMGIGVSFVTRDMLDRESDFVSDFFKVERRERLNHRKVVLSDNGDKVSFIITSANPHNPSSPNSNVGVYVEGGPAEEILSDEIKFIEMNSLSYDNHSLDQSDGELGVRYLRNAGLVNFLSDEIGKTTRGDKIDIATFIFSEDKVLKALVKASQRGVDIRIVLDKNIESFGAKKDGAPNILIAEVLDGWSGGEIDIRWYQTHGEQFHTKFAIINRGNFSTVLLGSSNLTPKSGPAYNMEADVSIRGSLGVKFIDEAHEYYERIWGNEGGIYTSGEYVD